MTKAPLIPKIIHQIWLGPKEPPTQWMKTWPACHSDWEYKLWTDQNIPPLYNQKQFDKITAWTGKADILRVELLYRWGGIYLDADCECLTPLDDSLRKPAFFGCYENELLRPGLLQNGVIGSVPGHELLEHMMRAIADIEDVNAAEPWAIVGPFLFTKIVKHYQARRGSIKILPSYKFTPIHYWGSRYRGRGKVYATHHWSTTTGKTCEESKFHFRAPKTKKL